MNDVIGVAFDGGGHWVHIGQAARGGRYKGTTQFHGDWELYPVFRKTKLSSDAHIPGKSPCPNPSGKSEAHKRTKEEWFAFLERQRSGCLVCRMCPSQPHLNCPVQVGAGPTSLRGHNMDLF